ncbi:FeoA family protein [Stratiformator vulcanicus]|uniref:FeoA domain protein n=1 Tax=Stratiformator vulcanicus TaxID=2527980 RepID=A0A517QVW3_9PLAN|nr:FeoA domain-containing protein [Stratiformator vulcanicus]QDT35792.1 FeoA domain protein [Stratiformator vulcanicus]
MRTLRQLGRGETGTVVEVRGEDAVAIRLMEMGITEGESMTFRGAAPLGDPLEFLLRGYHLSLRASEADRVVISES